MTRATTIRNMQQDTETEGEFRSYSKYSTNSSFRTSTSYPYFHYLRPIGLSATASRSELRLIPSVVMIPGPSLVLLMPSLVSVISVVIQ